MEQKPKADEANDSSKSEERKGYSYSDIVELVGCGKAHYMVCFIVGMIPLTVGILTQGLIYQNYLLTCSWDWSPKYTTIYSISMAVGVSIGSIFFGFISDLWSRKKSLLMSMGITGVFFAISCVSEKKEILIPLQFLAAVVLGGTLHFEVYFFELLPVSCRIKGKAYINTILGLGFILSFGLTAITAGEDILYMILGHSIMPFITFFTIFLLPESPSTSFLEKGDKDDALHTISIASVMNKKILAPGKVMVDKDFLQPFSKVLFGSQYIKVSFLCLSVFFIIGVTSTNNLLRRVYTETEYNPQNMTIEYHESKCVLSNYQFQLYHLRDGISKIAAAVFALILCKCLKLRIWIIILNIMIGLFVLLNFALVGSAVKYLDYPLIILMDTNIILLTIVFLSSLPSRIRASSFGSAIFLTNLGSIIISACIPTVGVSLYVPIIITGVLQIVAAIICFFLPPDGENKPLF